MLFLPGLTLVLSKAWLGSCETSCELWSFLPLCVPLHMLLAIRSLGLWKIRVKFPESNKPILRTDKLAKRITGKRNVESSIWVCPADFGTAFIEGTYQLVH